GGWKLEAERCLLRLKNAQRSTSNAQGSMKQCSSPKGRLACAVIDILVLELGRQFGRKVVHLHDHPANAGNEKVVSEHRRNGYAQSGHCCNQCAGYARRHRDETGRSGFGHAGEGVHDTPNCAEQAKKRRARKARVLLKQAQRLSILSKSSNEPHVLFSSEADHAQFRDHYRPTENRRDGQKSENEFSCDRCVIERKEETAGG